MHSHRADESCRERIAWTPAMEQLLGTDFDAAIARRLGIDPAHVAHRRRTLGIAAHAWPPHAWTPEDDALLGTATIAAVATALGIPTSQVKKRMAQLGAVPVRTRRVTKTGRRWGRPNSDTGGELLPGRGTAPETGPSGPPIPRRGGCATRVEHRATRAAA
jgi:hypothetical protein